MMPDTLMMQSCFASRAMPAARSRNSAPRGVQSVGHDRLRTAAADAAEAGMTFGRTAHLRQVPRPQKRIGTHPRPLDGRKPGGLRAPQDPLRVRLRRRQGCRP